MLRQAHLRQGYGGQAQHDEIVRHPEQVSDFYEPKSKGIFVHGTRYASTSPPTPPGARRREIPPLADARSG